MKRRSTHQPAKSLKWRPLAWAATALTAMGLTAGFATAALAAAPNPAPGVAPGTTAVGTNNNIFYTAADGSVWQKVLDSSSPATAVMGRLISAPSAITIADGTIQVFGEGTDHALWTTNCNPGGACGAWTSLGGVLTSKPGAVFVGAASVVESVYVRGSDGTVWVRNLNRSNWDPWAPVGGRLLAGTGPAAAYNGTNQYVLGVGTNQGLYLLQVGVGGFKSVGGRSTASPGLTFTTPDNKLWGIVRGTNNAGFYSNLTGTTWTSFGGIVTSGFSATANVGSAPPAQVPYAYALGQDGQVWQNGGPSPTNWSAVTP
jgi:hypothetical protein